MGDYDFGTTRHKTRLNSLVFECKEAFMIDIISQKGRKAIRYDRNKCFTNDAETGEYILRHIKSKTKMKLSLYFYYIQVLTQNGS